MLRRYLGSILLGFVVAFFTSGLEARARAAEEVSHQAGVFDYYVLSLSWSPTYCLTHPHDSPQCTIQKGFGFVLHGLWPQYAKGGYPQNCPTADRLTAEAIAFGNTIFPSPTLIDHEWGKHGTCSGLNALDYFKVSDQVRTSVKVPVALDSPEKTQYLTAAQIIASIVAENPGMTKESLAVACSGPRLSEVRVCFDRQLSPMACGKDVRSTCGRKQIRVPAVR